MRPTNWKLPTTLWIGWLCAALFLQFGPPAVRQSLELGVTESAGWLLALIDAGVAERARTGVVFSWSEGVSTTPDAGLAGENRRLTLEVARLRAELSRLQQVPPPLGPNGANESAPLLETDVIAARVIGRRGSTGESAQRMLVALGNRQGLVGDELVLTGAGLLIDRGADSGIDRDRLVRSREGLFGRTVEVGRWTSAVQPMTDPEFRTAVRLVRRASIGPVFGSQGILAGTGTGCRLNEVPATEPVAVGDFVYTEGALSPGGEPIYCGRVTRADVAPGEPHWTVDVAPLYGPAEVPGELRILRTALNLEAR